MGWQDDSVPTLRVIIDDLGSQPVYNDSRLEELLIVAAKFIDQEVTFSTTYTISIPDCSITPEPDDTFNYLMVLKAACILTRGIQRLGADKAYVIHDGPSKIDGKQVAIEKKNVANDYCKQYEDAVEQHRLGNAVVGRAITGPSNSTIPFRSHSDRSRAN